MHLFLLFTVGVTVLLYHREDKYKNLGFTEQTSPRSKANQVLSPAENRVLSGVFAGRVVCQQGL